MSRELRVGSRQDDQNAGRCLAVERDDSRDGIRCYETVGKEGLDDIYPRQHRRESGAPENLLPDL